MTTHTPGPWRLRSRYDNFGPTHSLFAANTLIAKVYSEAFGDIEQETANARLIAAAPESHASNVELAAIVREICLAYGHPIPEAALARSDAAIKKATGDEP